MIYNTQNGQIETLAQLRRAFPASTIPQNAAAEQLAKFDRMYVEKTPPPEGDVVTQAGLEMGEDGILRQTWDVRDYTQEELDAQEKAAVVGRFTFKTDIWQRCTNDEAEYLDGQLESASAKEKRMWNDSLTIEHSSSYYTMLRQQMLAAFGEERTETILAPSQGN